MEQAERVAFCGLGTMGGPMAANLARAGFDLSVWTHTEEGRALRGRARRAGRRYAPEAAEGAGVVITMVVDAPQVQAVLLGDQGAAEALAGFALPRHVDDRPHRGTRSGRGTRAPRPGASGGARVRVAPKAEDGTLTIMAGGERSDFERALPILEVMGELIVLVGPVDTDSWPRC